MKEKLTGVPRRANKIRQMAGEAAAKHAHSLLERQKVSDKIGYAVAVTIGSVAGYLAWWAGLLVIGYYTLGAIRAYRNYRKAQ